MKITKSSRGFARIRFTDRYGEKCSLSKTSLAFEDTIWFGIEDADPQILASNTLIHGVEGWVRYDIPENVLLKTHMHLTKEMVKELLPYLENFVKTGNIY